MAGIHCAGRPSQRILNHLCQLAWRYKAWEGSRCSFPVESLPDLDFPAAARDHQGRSGPWRASRTESLPAHSRHHIKSSNTAATCVSRPLQKYREPPAAPGAASGRYPNAVSEASARRRIRSRHPQPDRPRTFAALGSASVWGADAGCLHAGKHYGKTCCAARSALTVIAPPCP